MFGRFYGLYNYFILAGVLNIFLTYILLKTNPLRKMGLFLIFFPLVLSTFAVIFALIKSIFLPGLLGFIIYLTSSIFALLIYFHNKNKIIITLIYFITFMISSYNYENLMNFYNYNFEKNENVGKEIPHIDLLDENNNKTQIKKFNKIQVVDLWSNSCGVCIKSFPKFEKLKNHYKNDPDVNIFAVNVYNDTSEISQSKKYTKKYTFKNYYTDKKILAKLNFSAYPYYMIIGKDGKIKYFGDLNIETSETYNNIYELIDNEK